MDEQLNEEIKEEVLEDPKNEKEKPKYNYPMWMKKRIGEPGNYKWVPVVEEDFKNWIHLPGPNPNY